MLNVATKALHRIDLQTGHANRMALTPDGTRALVNDEARDLPTTSILVVPDGSRAYVTAIPQEAIRPGEQALLQPAGSYIAEIDLQTLEVTRRIDTGGDRPDYLAWAAPK